jgi:hypothetical protein
MGPSVRDTERAMPQQNVEVVLRFFDAVERHLEEATGR